MKRKIDKKQCAAFTLVEILATMAVVAILIGLLVPALSGLGRVYE